ncbi:hypothetical protein FG167_11185 [Lacinutrix sp. WUR7]|uniref:hypothetical protein n=1 Tax=Lacinutrix sp. WUR7 TaxID=2653681 RepID=UPI00193DDEA3|nr:hypothetical protein [Lacinutrix sp. WUR7]QRM89766.1 hypothetical protein FG167_11185 [Lacinutrix sp. WUR7]
MKKILLITLSICFMNCSSQTEQNIDGKWYLINKSGFAEFTITKDSLINQKVFPNFDMKYKGRRAAKISKKVFLKDRILLLGENPKDSTEYYTLMTLVQSKDNNYLEYVWNGIDSISSIKTLTKINQNDNRELLGYNLYTKEYLETLRTKRSIENMTVEDFKKYLEIFSKNIKIATTEYKKNIKGYYGEASSFNFQIGSQTLLELDYNPIQDSNTMNSMFSKFMENEEIKEFMKTLKEK